MKISKSYEDAILELEGILNELETGNPKVEEMKDMAKRAKELVNYCQQKLRGIEIDINNSLDSIDETID